MAVQALHPPAAPRAGFTLHELLVVLTIVAVFLVAALPSYREYAAYTRATTLANELLGDLAVARLDTLTTGRTSRLKPLQGDWSQGWQVERESADGDAAVVRAISADEGVTIALKAMSGTAPDVVGFSSLGSVESASAGLAFDVCALGDGHFHHRLVLVSPSGRAEVRRSAIPSTTCG